MRETDPDSPLFEQEIEYEQRKIQPSYCGNSDLFVHGAFDTPRDLPDEYYKRTAEFFR